MVHLNLFTVRKWMSPKYWPHGAVAPRTLLSCLITLQCIYFLESNLDFQPRGNSQGRLMSWICLWKPGHLLKLKLFCLDLHQLSNPLILSSNACFSIPDSCDMKVDTSCYLQSHGLIMGRDRETMHTKAVRDKKDVWYKPPGTLCLAVHWGPSKLGSISSTALCQPCGCPCNPPTLSQACSRRWRITVSRIRHSLCHSRV